MTMQKWEYMLIIHYLVQEKKESKWYCRAWHGDDPLTDQRPGVELTLLMDYFGEQGWELVTGTSTVTYEQLSMLSTGNTGTYTNAYRYYFKRPKP